MIKNLTPHIINIHDEQGNVTVVPPEPATARVAVNYERDGEIDSVPTYRAVYGEVEGLPAPESGVALVVSMLVASAAPRADVFSPGDLIRDEGGRPIGCKGLKRS